jgi:hypothetical protein
MVKAGVSAITTLLLEMLSNSAVIGPPAPSFQSDHETNPNEHDSKRADQ